MAVHQIEALDSYVKYLQQTPVEIQALFNDLLIGVTNFFRDPEAFAVLQAQVIPKLFHGKPAGSAVRVWCSGCSTGEEAYSIAILLQEQLDVLRASYKVQVFATDIDSRAIAVARTGLYPAGIADDVSPERLGRFFTLESDGSAYRVNKGIRDLLVFSEQDVIKDPPFSKLDLTSAATAVRCSSRVCSVSSRSESLAGSAVLPALRGGTGSGSMSGVKNRPKAARWAP